MKDAKEKDTQEMPPGAAYPGDGIAYPGDGVAWPGGIAAGPGL